MAEIIDISTLEFDNLKNQIINYITSTQRGVDNPFTDQNKYGSNLNLLCSLLAYVTHILSYNLSLSINENYLSTAQLRSSVLKIVKMLGYKPRRQTSSNIKVDLSDIISTTETGALNILKYDSIKADDYIFYYTGERREITTTYLNDLTFYEGTLVSSNEAYTADGTSYQSFIIEDTNIGNYFVLFTYDTITGERIYWEEFDEGEAYSDAGNTYLYFIEEVDKGYKISFGNNTLGRIPLNDEKIGYDYIIPSGKDTNALSTFVFNSSGKEENVNADYTQKTIESCTVTLDADNTESLGYTEKESIEEIKFSAPLYYSTQGRAVTADDYYAIGLKHEWIEKLAVIGGQDKIPVQLGKVFITVKPDAEQYRLYYFTTADLATLKEYFEKYAVVSIEPVMSNAQFVYLKVTSLLRYITSQEPSANTVTTDIMTFVNTENSEFGDYLEYSKLLAKIDNADALIRSNITSVEKYCEITADNKVYNDDDEEQYGQYAIQLAKELKTSFTTKIEQYNFTTLTHTYTQDVDYTLTYTDASLGYVSIEFITTGEGLDITEDEDLNVNIISLYKSGNDQRMYVLGDKIEGPLSEGALEENATLVGAGDTHGGTAGDFRINYGLIDNLELTIGRFIVIVSGENKNHHYRITKHFYITEQIENPAYGQTGEPQYIDGTTYYYIDVENILPADDYTKLLKYDLFDVRERPEDLSAAPISLADNENIKATGINSEFEGFYQLATTGSIYNDGTDDIYISLNPSYNELPDFTLEELDFTDAQIYTDPQFSYRLFFETTDEDIFLNDGQLFRVNEEDITITTEKV